MNNCHSHLSPTDHSTPSMTIDFSHLMSSRTSPAWHFQIPFYTCTSCTVHKESVRHCHQRSYYTSHEICASWLPEIRETSRTVGQEAKRQSPSLCRGTEIFAGLKSSLGNIAATLSEKTCKIKLTQNHWICGLCPSSSILKTGKHNISES
jgi:hypothetical protein